MVYVAGTGMMNMLGALFTALLRTRLTLVVGGLAQVGNVVGRLRGRAAGLRRRRRDLGARPRHLGGRCRLPRPAAPAAAREGTAAPSSEATALHAGAAAGRDGLAHQPDQRRAAQTVRRLADAVFLCGAAAIGFFNLAFQLSHAAAFLLIAGLGGVGMAAMAAAFSGEDRAGLGAAWRSVSKAQMLLAVPVLAFFFIRADTIAVLLYGPQFAPVGVLMQVFLVFNIVQRIAGGGSHQAALYVLGRQTWAFAAQVAGLLLTIVIGALLIPRQGTFGGPGGALIAVGAGQVVVELLQLALAWRMLRRPYPIQFGLRVLLALAPALLVTAALRLDVTGALSGLGASGVSVALINAINLLFSGIIFTAVFIGGMLIARPVEADDVALLAQLNPRLRLILAPFAHRAAPSPTSVPDA